MKRVFFGLVYNPIEPTHISIDYTFELFSFCLRTRGIQIVRKKYFMYHEGIELIDERNFILCYSDSSKLSELYDSISNIVHGVVLETIRQYAFDKFFIKNTLRINGSVYFGYRVCYGITGKRKAS